MVWRKILRKENFEMDQRGDHSMHVMWSPLWFWRKNSKIEILVFKMKKCLFLSKEIVSIRIGWFGGRFWGKKILKWTKGGTTVCMSCGPPFGFDEKIQKLKYLFKMKKCLFLSKEIVSIRIGWFGGRFWGKKILKWTKGGTTVSMHVMWSPLWFWQKIQKLKYLFLRWKNACFYQRK